ncbi:MAG: DNA repair protein RecN [Planctomycetota bacterium]
MRNLLIVERAVLRPARGLTVITGETGAGKSLLLDALDLLLGGRGGSRLIGPHGQVCTVSGVFRVADAVARRILEPHGIDAEAGEVIVRRRLTAGRSQAWINDVPVGVGVLRAVGGELVEIRVQHEHLRLGRRERQMELLDAYGGCAELAQSYATAHRACVELEEEVAGLEAGESDSLKALDYHRFLLEEIETVQPVHGEYEELCSRQELLARAQEWRCLSAEAFASLVEGDAPIVQRLGALADRLAEAPQGDLQEAATNLSAAAELVQEAGMACARAGDVIEVDEQALAAVEERLTTCTALIRKHGGTEAALLDAWQAIAAKVAELRDVDGRLESARTELARARKQRSRLGERLAQARTAAFGDLAQRAHAELAELGMPQARLELDTRPTERPGPLGTVHQELLVCTNPGIPPGPLGGVPSGGESSRLTLALAVALADKDDTPVLVFDEVDSGVGGRLGAVIGNKLARLGRGRTVMAVTHTPQVAARADRQYVVRKQHRGQATVVAVALVEDADRQAEIADMLGGGSAAAAQARELLRERAG